MNVAVIPARGGSKRIPGKNIRPFHGRPIIAFSIDAALASGCFERIIVSTDDEAIAAVARDCGAEVPFVRPPSVSDDQATIGHVMAHALAWLADNGTVSGAACCLYATAPFVTAADLQQGLDALSGPGLDYAVAVAQFSYPVQRSCRITDEGRLTMADPAMHLVRSQDLEPRYHDAGQFCWGRAEAWAERRPVFGECTAPLVLPAHRVHDIDTLEDWTRAEWLYATMCAFPDAP